MSIKQVTPFYFILFLFVIVTCTSIQAPSSAKPKRLVLKLSFYKTKFPLPNYKILDFQSFIPPDQEHIRFLVHFYIGDLARPQKAIMDMGSSFSWIQCDTCSYLKYNSSRYFTPNTSISYVTLKCDAPMCKEFPNNACNEESYCQYSAIYVSDTIEVAGLVGTDELIFVANSAGSTSITTDIKFGCGNIDCNKADNSLFGDPSIFGVFGLGPGKASFLKQMRYNQFSYCIGNLRDVNYSGNKLIIGEDDSYLSGHWTSMDIYYGHYYVSLDDIQVGVEKVRSRMFRAAADGGGLIIDSGALYTFLVTDAYNALREKIKRQMDDFGFQRAWTLDDKDLCYSGTIENNLKVFPKVIFNFANNLLELPPKNVFYQKGKRSFCLAMYPSVKRLGSRSVLGLIAQQNFNWGFDLARKRIYFQNIDCEKVPPSHS